MASHLTKGISFRRQGSSGLIWADSWPLHDEKKPASGMQASSKLQLDERQEEEGGGGGGGERGFATELRRSKSSGSSNTSYAAIAYQPQPQPQTQPQPQLVPPSSSSSSSSSSHKSRISKWVKKTFVKQRH